MESTNGSFVVCVGAVRCRMEAKIRDRNFSGRAFKLFENHTMTRSIESLRSNGVRHMIPVMYWESKLVSSPLELFGRRVSYVGGRNDQSKFLWACFFKHVKMD